MAIVVTTITPSNLLTGQSKEVWVAGYGFSGQVSCLINGIFLPTFFTTPNMVKFVLPSMGAGTYDIKVINGDDSIFTARQALVVSDPPAGVVIGILGSADQPIVLPAVIVESSCTAVLNSSLQNRRYKGPATIYADPLSGETIATKALDASVIATEAATNDTIASTPSSGQVISTPFGTFTN
jgi:hypothetical protein